VDASQIQNALGSNLTEAAAKVGLDASSASNLLAQYLPNIINANTPKALQPNQLNYWKNTPAFFVSFLKWMYGDNATAENNWAYDWLPKYQKMYDILQITEDMYQGKMKGLLVQGFNAQGSFPDASRVTEAFSKLKFMVVMDPLKTETASFWENHGDAHATDPSKIGTEVFRLPTRNRHHAQYGRKNFGKSRARGQFRALNDCRDCQPQRRQARMGAADERRLRRLCHPARFASARLR